MLCYAMPCNNRPLSAPSPRERSIQCTTYAWTNVKCHVMTCNVRTPDKASYPQNAMPDVKPFFRPFLKYKDQMNAPFPHVCIVSSQLHQPFIADHAYDV